MDRRSELEQHCVSFLESSVENADLDLSFMGE